MKSLLHYPGSRKRIASWIIENMPEQNSLPRVETLWMNFETGGAD